MSAIKNKASITMNVTVGGVPDVSVTTRNNSFNTMILTHFQLDTFIKRLQAAQAEIKVNMMDALLKGEL